MRGSGRTGVAPGHRACPSARLGFRHLCTHRVSAISVLFYALNTADELRTKIVGDEIEGLGVIGDLGVEPGEVEAVEDVVLLDFAKVLVPL